MTKLSIELLEAAHGDYSANANLLRQAASQLDTQADLLFYAGETRAKLEAERAALRTAAQSALSQLCWREFGECRIDDKPIPTAKEVEQQLHAALEEI